jgi:hypothetical protein
MRYRRRAAIGIAAGLAAFAATVALALTRTGGTGSAPLTLAAASTLGPEGVAVPEAPSLGRARPVAAGRRIDGISCQAHEQVLFHIHAHLTIFVRGAARRVPAGIGIGKPSRIVKTPRGAFVAGGACFMWLHTHAADGIIHTESPVERTYTLGEFFDIWGQPLSRNQTGPVRGHVTALVNGRVFTGNPRDIPLLAHSQIQVEVGRPLVAPAAITFPDGL